ncbi:MAG: hypothetical protein IJ593_05715 [Lachnospiraceae bacterium]|nr:hypothetical protein [Lachnospiraceae bacterium]
MKFDKEEIMYHIEELKKSRIFLSIIALIVGLIVAFVLTPAFTEALKGKKEVVKIITDVNAGDKITERMLVITEVGGYNLDNNIATSKEEVIGLYAQVDMKANTYVYKNYVSNISPLNNDYLKKDLDGLKRAISFKVKDDAKPVANKLQQNDIVTLIFTKVGQSNETILDPYLKFVKVLAVTTDTGRDFNSEDVYKDDYDEGLIETITVLANEEQAARIAEMDEMAVIHCALVYREGQKNISNYLLEKQDEIINFDKYGEEGVPLEIEEDNEEIQEVFVKNYSDDEELNFGNREQMLNYVAKILKSDLRNGVVSTISEIYRNYYNPVATKSNLATASNATRSVIIRENTTNTNESAVIASMSNTIEEYKKDIEEKDDIIKEYEEQLEEYQKQIDTYSQAIKYFTNPQTETTARPNIIIPGTVGY